MSLRRFLEASKDTKQERLTSLNQQESPLLRLPAELRNSIYELAFQGTVVKVHGPLKLPPKARPDRDRGGCQLAYSLLLVCRQTRHEAFDAFYTASTFDFAHLERGLDEDSAKWLDSITVSRLCSISVPIHNMLNMWVGYPGQPEEGHFPRQWTVGQWASTFPMLRYIHVFQYFYGMSSEAQSHMLEEEELTKAVTDAFGDNMLVVSASPMYEAAQAISAIARVSACTAAIRSALDKRHGRST